MKLRMTLARAFVNENWSPNLACDLAAYVARGVRYAPPVSLSHKAACAAEVGAERLPPCMGLIEPIDEHSCLFEMGASTFESLAMHLVDQVRRLTTA